MSSQEENADSKTVSSKVRYKNESIRDKISRIRSSLSPMRKQGHPMLTALAAVFAGQPLSIAYRHLEIIHVILSAAKDLFVRLARSFAAQDLKQ